MATYYTLIGTEKESGLTGELFGDFDKECVQFEKDVYRGCGEYKQLKIVISEEKNEEPPGAILVGYQINPHFPLVATIKDLYNPLKEIRVYKDDYGHFFIQQYVHNQATSKCIRTTAESIRMVYPNAPQELGA